MAVSWISLVEEMKHVSTASTLVYILNPGFISSNNMRYKLVLVRREEIQELLRWRDSVHPDLEQSGFLEVLGIHHADILEIFRWS